MPRNESQQHMNLAKTTTAKRFISFSVSVVFSFHFQFAFLFYVRTRLGKYMSLANHKGTQRGRLNKHFWWGYTALLKYCIYCASMTSLHRESTNSDILFVWSFLFSPNQISVGFIYADQGHHVQLAAEHVALDPTGISSLGYRNQVVALVSVTL